METNRSWRGVLAGAIIALTVPITYLVAARLLDGGITVIVRGPDTMGTLTTIALTEVLLGPVGIVVAGRSARLRGAIVWLAYLVVAIPLVLFVWFLCVAMLSGALGSPF